MAGARALFASVDTNGDGVVSADELLAHLLGTGVEPELAAEIFEHLDANADGVIDLEEFLRGERAWRAVGVGDGGARRMPESWFARKWSDCMNNNVVLAPDAYASEGRRAALVAMSYASSFGSAIKERLAAQGEMEMANEMVSVGICRGIRLQLLKALGLHEQEIYLDCENFLYEPGTKLVGRRVLNDHWERFYFRALEESRVMLIFLTEGYFESVYCRQEVESASTSKPKVVVTQEEGPSAAERADLERIRALGGSVWVCRDGDEGGIADAVRGALADAGVQLM